MKKTTSAVPILKREFTLPTRLGMRYRSQVGAVLNTLFRISCWSAVAWLVWNHALSNFFSAGSIGPLPALGFGTFLHAASTILEEGEA